MAQARGCLIKAVRPMSVYAFVIALLLSAMFSAHPTLGSGMADGDRTVLPRVVETYPKNRDIDVPVDTVITVKFSKPMNASTITPENFYAYNPEDGDLFKGEIIYDNSTFEAKYIPTGEVTKIAMGGHSESAGEEEEHHEMGKGWHYGATIRVVLKSEIRDVYGNPLDGDGDGVASDYIFEFTVEQQPKKENKGAFIPFPGAIVSAIVMAIATLSYRMHKKRKIR